MTRRFAGVLVVTILLVVAGCTGPATTGTPGGAGTALDGAAETATPGASTGADASSIASETDTPRPTATPRPTPTPTATPEPVDPWSKVTVRGGNFSFDEAQVYRRVVEMTGFSLDEVPHVTVFIRNRSEVPISNFYQPSAFEEAMGITPEAGNTSIAGVARGNQVWIYENVLTTAHEREAVLAHEFAHVMQTKLGAQEYTARNVGGEETQEDRVESAITEGAATYTEHRYRVTYLNESDDLDSWEAVRSNRSAFGAFLIAPYVFGTQYVANEVDSVVGLDDVYLSPPQTTEQLLHGLDPDAEPPRDLSVTASTIDSNWSETARRTKGELFVRLVLERQLSLNRAEAGAAGWGADEMVAFERDNATGFAWTLRWDAASEAAEFEEAFRDYLDARGDRSGDTWTVNGTAFRIVQVSDDTVTVLVGASGFVSETAVSGDGETVQIEPAG